MEEKKFDKTKYDIEYHKLHKSRFVADLNKDEMQELNDLLKQNNITKVELVRRAIKQLKEETKKN